VVILFNFFNQFIRLDFQNILIYFII